MANPQPTDAHLRVAHSINEAIMLRDFTKRQRKVLDLILRLSWGCGKKEANIPRQKDFCVVGIYEPDVRTEIDWLIESKIVTRREGAFYAFQKDFDQWQISRVKPYQPEKLSELLRINLNGNCPELSETLSKNLVKHSVGTKQNTKFATPELATAKEKIKEILNKDTLSNKGDVDNKKIYGEFENVRLTDNEYSKLVAKFGEDEAKGKIAGLSESKASKGYKNKSDYATILNWARRDGDKAAQVTQGSNSRKPAAAQNPRPVLKPHEYTRPEDLDRPDMGEANQSRFPSKTTER